MKKIAECGTRSGYHRHLKEKTIVCEDCKNAQRAYDRQRYNANKTYFKEKNNRNFNRDAKLARWRKRYALMMGNHHEKYSIEEILERYGKVCYLCNEDIDMNAPRSSKKENWQHGLHIDHVVPISKGGSDSLNNVRPAHAVCNLKKGNRLRMPMLNISVTS